MRREGKVGPFIPCEVRAQTGPARGDNACGRIEASSGDHNRRRPGESVSARATMSTPRRERMRAGDNVCAYATMGDAWEGCFFTNTPNFSAQATTSASGRQCMRPCDDIYDRATLGAAWEGVFSQTPQTLALGRRRMRPGDNAYVRATTSALAQRRRARAFMIRAGFARPNCEYEKKDFLKKLQWRKF